MLKRAARILFLTLLTLIILLKYFLYLDLRNSCGLVIFPSFLEFNNGTVMEAIRILKHASPEDYKDLCDNTSTINPNPNCGGYEGGCFYDSQSKNIYVNISGRDPALTSAVIVHEVCHLLQYKESRTYSEEECYRKDSDLLTKIVQVQ